MNTGQYITDGDVTWIVTDIRDGMPVGSVIQSLCMREGYIKANGATVLRADYPRLAAFAEERGLFTDDKTTYPGLFGKGDGTTTMVLPDFRNVFMQGSDGSAGTGVKAGLPNITGEHSVTCGGISKVTGAFYTSGSVTHISTTVSGADPGVFFNASRSSSIYGNSTTVQPPAIKTISLIKY